MRLSIRLVFSFVVAGSLGCGASHDGGMDGGRDAGAEAIPDTGPAPSPDAGRDAGRTADAAPTPMDAGPLLPPIDAGDPFGDGGALGTPAWVPIDVIVDGSECPAFTPCGGDVEGTWDVTGGCVEVPIGEELMRCPGATVTASGRARGRVTFEGGFATRIGQSEVVAELFVPSFCAGFVGGCSGLESMIRMANPDARCVADAARDCTCAIRRVDVTDDSDAYTIEGDQIVSASTGRRWDYCVEDSTLRYRDVSSGDREPGTIELGRR